MPFLSVIPVSSAARLFKALGDDTRLKIVAALSHGELCVCHVETMLGLSQPTASRHLGVLRNAGVVEARREGSWMYYRIAPQLDEASKRQLRLLVATFAKDATLKADIARLLKSRGPTPCR